MREQARREQIPKLLEMVGLKGREKDLMGKYSKGMQHRIGIAQALLDDPELTSSIGVEFVYIIAFLFIGWFALRRAQISE